MPDDRTPIPQDWIKNYVDQLIAVAGSFDKGSVMQQAAALRAEHIMDMVKAFRNRPKPPEPPPETEEERHLRESRENYFG